MTTAVPRLAPRCAPTSAGVDDPAATEWLSAVADALQRRGTRAP